MDVTVGGPCSGWAGSTMELLWNSSIRPSLEVVGWGWSILGSLHVGGPLSASFFARDKFYWVKGSLVWSSAKMKSEREKFDARKWSASELYEE
jgi:hypothetical protein